MTTKLMVVAQDESVKSIVRFLLDLPGVTDVRFMKEDEGPSDPVPEAAPVDLGPAPRSYTPAHSLRMIGREPDLNKPGRSINGAHWIPSEDKIRPTCMWLASRGKPFINSRELVKFNNLSYKSCRDILAELERRKLVTYSHKEGMGGLIQYRITDVLIKKYSVPKEAGS